MPACMGKKKVFISSSSRDRREAFEIKRLLEGHQVDVGLAFFDTETTSHLHEPLASRVHEAELLCLLLSPSAVESPGVTRGVEAARAFGNPALRILPIILRPCRVPAVVADAAALDATVGLEHEWVRLQLIRAVCGEHEVQGGLLLDAETKRQVSIEEMALRAEAELPRVEEQLSELARQPIRRVVLEIRTETLPANPNIVLELQLRLDSLFHGRMSFFISPYREGRTWPREFGFEEPPFTEFFLTERPRVDVQFKWFDRVIPLRAAADTTDLKQIPTTFTLDCDGREFKPKGAFALSQTFEIPALDALQKQKSEFRLVAHDTEAKQASEVLAETDIDITLSGEVGEHRVCLYACRTTACERTLLASPFFKAIASPIGRSARLRHYVSRAEPDRRAEILAALQKGEFESEEQRRLAARLCFGSATASFSVQASDAFEQYQQAAELLKPLVLEQSPSVQDAALMYKACRALVQIGLRQNAIHQASQLAETLASVAGALLEWDTQNADYQRMWADAALINAEIHARLGDKKRTARELFEHVSVLERLFTALPSRERKLEHSRAIAHALESAVRWEIEAALPLSAWKQSHAQEWKECRSEADDMPN